MSANVFASVCTMTTSVFYRQELDIVNFPSIAVQNLHHLILLISDSYENAKTKKLRFGIPNLKVVNELPDAAASLIANMPLICGKCKLFY